MQTFISRRRISPNFSNVKHLCHWKTCRILYKRSSLSDLRLVPWCLNDQFLWAFPQKDSSRLREDVFTAASHKHLTNFWVHFSSWRPLNGCESDDAPSLRPHFIWLTFWPSPPWLTTRTLPTSVACLNSTEETCHQPLIDFLHIFFLIFHETEDFRIVTSIAFTNTNLSLFIFVTLSQRLVKSLKQNSLQGTRNSPVSVVGFFVAR